MGRRKLTTAEKVYQYMAKHPTAKPKQIAEVLGVRVEYVYFLRSTGKKKNAPKRMIIHAGEALIAQKMGIPLAEYAKQKLELKTKRKAQPKWQTPELLPMPTLPITMEEPKSDPVNHPAHYKAGGIETIDFIEAKGLNYRLGNVVKYVTRADHKNNRRQDLEKAMWYLKREIEQTPVA